MSQPPGAGGRPAPSDPEFPPPGSERPTTPSPQPGGADASGAYGAAFAAGYGPPPEAFGESDPDDDAIDGPGRRTLLPWLLGAAVILLSGLVLLLVFLLS